MNKKAQFGIARKSIYWMIAGVIITMIVLAFAFIISGYKEKYTTISPKLKGELLSLRFTNNSDCFAYQDEETGRVYPGVIDRSKFNQEQLDDCYKTDEKTGRREINFKFKLGEKEIKTNHFSIDHYTILRYVLVYEGGQFVPEILEIIVHERERR